MEQPLPPPFDKWLSPIVKIAFTMRALNSKLTLSQIARLVRPEIEKGRVKGTKKPSLDTIKGLLKNKILSPCIDGNWFRAREYVAFHLPWHKSPHLLEGVLGNLTSEDVSRNAGRISNLLEKRLRILVGDGVIAKRVTFYGPTDKTHKLAKNGSPISHQAPEVDNRHFTKLDDGSRLPFIDVAGYLSQWDSLHSPSAYIARVDVALHHFTKLGGCIGTPSISALWSVPYSFRIGFSQRFYSVPYFGVLKPEMVNSVDELTSPEKIVNLQRREQGHYFFDPFLLFAGAFDEDKIQQVTGQMNEKHIKHLVIV